MVADHDCDDVEDDCKEDEDVSAEEDDEVCPASFHILTGYVIVLLKVFMIHWEGRAASTVVVWVHSNPESYLPITASSTATSVGATSSSSGEAYTVIVLNNIVGIIIGNMRRDTTIISRRMLLQISEDLCILQQPCILRVPPQLR